MTLILFAASVSVGVANMFSGSLNDSVLFISRLPRTFALVLTGASMAVAGMIMQILLKNRFVEPSMVENVGIGDGGVAWNAGVYDVNTQIAAYSTIACAFGGNCFWWCD